MMHQTLVYHECAGLSIARQLRNAFRANTVGPQLAKM